MHSVQLSMGQPRTMPVVVTRPEERSTKQTLQHPRDPVLAEWFGEASNTIAGVSVNSDTAMRQSVVYACVRVLAETNAALPLRVYRRKGMDRERATDHPLWPLLHDAPNRLQTSFEWREQQTACAALRGNAYNRIVMNGAGRVTEIVPMHPDNVSPVALPGGGVAWRYTPTDAAPITLLDDEVLRLPMLSADGVTGLNPIQLHRETIGLAIAMRQHGAAMFGNSAVPKGGIKIPGGVQDATVELIRSAWEKRHRGPENAGRVAIFDHGMEWQPISMANDDAQYIETMQFTGTDICRIFRVPPHMVADLTKSAFSNIEQQSIDFVMHTIVPWVTRWEQRLNRSLLSASERREFFVAFDVKGLLRGDAVARAALYNALFQTGAIDPDTIARLEDLPPAASNGGERFVPMNMAPLSRVMDAPTEAPGVTQ